jgi:hypothetical protein
MTTALFLTLLSTYSASAAMGDLPDLGPAAAQDSCTQDLKTLVGKSAKDLEKKLCARLIENWNVQVGKRQQYTVRHYETATHRIFVLDLWDTKTPFNPLVLDVLALPRPAGTKEQFGFAAKVYCWEKGKKLFQQDDYNVALVFARIDEKRKVTPLKVWALDKEKGKLVQVKTEAVECDPSAYHREYERTFTPAQKSQHNERLKGRESSSPWEDPDPLH